MTWDILSQVYDEYVELVSSNKHTKLMHNGAYEIGIHRANDIPINDHYVDTMIAAHLADENFGKSLKDLTWIHTSFGGYDTPLEIYKSDNRIKEDYSKIPEDVLAPYGGYDAVATFILWKKLGRVLKDEHTEPLFSKIVMPVRRVMSEAEFHGLRVNLDYSVDLQKKCTKAISMLEDRVYDIVGEEFNINSPPQLAKMLYTKLGLRPLKVSKKTKVPSTDKDSIEHITEQPDGEEIGKILQERNFMQTMLGTHINQPIDFLWETDGRVHTSYNLTGAVTGRASCSKPSLHNVPRDRLIRTQYIASEGHILIEADLKSAELAYLAAESREQAFLNAFKNGLDLHSETAKIIYQVDEPTEEQRSFAKSTNFALVYGMTAFGLSKRLGISVEEAQDFIDEYFDRFPRIADFMERQRDFARENGYVTSLFHRRRRLPQALSDIEQDVAHAMRQAQNSPIQSGAADYTYLGLVRLSRLLKRENMRAKIVHTVHDCAIVDTPIAEKSRVETLIIEAFEKPIKILPVQMKVEIESGKAWGEHTKTSRVEEILESVGLKSA